MRRQYRTGDQALVREMNLSTVLRCLQDGAPLSRSQLAELTGLNKTTVSSLVEELFELTLVHEVGLDTSRGGRPARLLDLNPRAGFVIGVELGVDFISVIVSDFVGTVVWRKRVDTDPEDPQDEIINLLLDLIDEARDVETIQGVSILGIGVALPGMVDVRNGILLFSPNLQWRSVDLRHIVQTHTNLPVFVENDANAAAIGEHLFGIAHRVHDFVFVVVHIGLGAGLFLNGNLYRGAGGIAGEVGHTSITTERGRPCRCGNRGCWETFGNQYSLEERVRALLEVGRESLVPQLQSANRESVLTPALIAQAARQDDAVALEALDETGRMIGLGIANLINIFNPNLVVIGGTMSDAGEFLLPAIDTAVKERTLIEMQQQVEVKLSAFGANASVMGAVAIVVRTTLLQPTRVGNLASPDSLIGWSSVRERTGDQASDSSHNVSSDQSGPDVTE